jgi:protocatechuate 3,4-dioxygenase beta subunit
MLRPQSLLLIALGALLACVAYFALAGDASDAGDTRAGAGARGARSDTGAVLALDSLNPEGTRADVAKRSSELTGASRDSELERARSAGQTQGARFDSQAAGTREAVYTPSPGGVPMAWGGSLRDGNFRAKIEGAKVILSLGDRRAEGLSNENGVFEVQWVEGLPADVRVEHESYLDLNLAAHELEPDAEFELLPSATIRGRLSPLPPADANAGEPARVDLWREQSKSGKDWPRISVLVDEYGEFSFPDLDPGNFSLCAFAGTWAGRLESGVHVDGGEVRTVELTCAKGALLKGKLEWAQLPPMDNAELLLASVTGKLAPNGKGLPKVLRTEREIDATIDEEGAFILEGIAPGSHRLLLETPWGSRPSFGIDIDASGDEVEREFKVQAPGSLTGYVLDAKGSPLMGAVVSVVRRKDKRGLSSALDAEAVADDGSPLFAGPVMTDADGVFSFGIVPVGEELLAVALVTETSAVGAPTWETVAPIAPGEARTGVQLRLEEPRYIRGHVRVAGALEINGEHLVGASIRAYISNDGREFAMGADYSEEDGSYQLGPLAEGAVRLTAQLEGYIDESMRIVVASADFSDVDLYLERAMSFSGVVVDESGAAVSGVRVRASVDDPELVLAEKTKDKKSKSSRSKQEQKESTSKARLTTADEFGRFRFDDLSSDNYYLTVSSPDWELVRTAPRVMSELAAQAGQNIEVIVRRRKSAERCSVSFSVLAGLTGLAPEELEIRGLNGQVTVDGIDVHATGLAPGHVRIWLSAKSCVSKAIDLDLVPGEEYPLGLVQLSPGAQLTVTVRGESEVLSAKVRLLGVSLDDGGLGEGVRPPKFSSIGEGRYRVKGVPLGNWRLRVDSKGYKRYTNPFVIDELKENTTTSLEKKRP